MNGAYYEKYMKYKTKYIMLKNIIGGDNSNKFMITSDSLINNKRIDDKYTKYHENDTPDIKWNNAPEKSKLLLLCYDPDAKHVANKIWIHWLVYNIDTYNSNSDISNGTVGTNSFGNRKYDGPKPPEKSGDHHYHFKLFALKDSIKLDETISYSYEDIINTIKDKIITESEIVVTYSKD